jgi:hypothetical protein
MLASPRGYLSFLIHSIYLYICCIYLLLYLNEMQYCTDWLINELFHVPLSLLHSCTI